MTLYQQQRLFSVAWKDELDRIRKSWQWSISRSFVSWNLERV